MRFFIIISLFIVLMLMFLTMELHNRKKTNNFVADIKYYCDTNKLSSFSFVYKNVPFEITIKQVYSDWYSQIEKVYINNADQEVLTLYRLEKTFMKTYYNVYSAYKSESEVYNILRAAAKASNKLGIADDITNKVKYKSFFK